MAQTSLIPPIPLFEGLDRIELERLADAIVHRHFPRNAIILWQEDSGGTLFILERGKVKVSLFSDEGREIVLATLGPGDCFGELAILTGGVRSATVTAVTDCDVGVLDGKTFEKALASSHKLALTLLRLLGTRLREADDRIGDLALLDVYGRVARHLLKIAAKAEKVGGVLVIHPAPSPTAIAERIGSSRETVSRVLSDLERRGIIARSDRTFVIRRPGALSGTEKGRQA